MKKKNSAIKLKLCTAVLSCILFAGVSYSAATVKPANVKIYSNLEKVNITDNYINQVQKLYDYNWDNYNYVETLKLSDYMVKLKEKRYGVNSEEAIKALIEESGYAIDAGKYDKSKEINEKLLKQLQTNNFSDELTSKINNLLYRYNQSIENYQEVLKILSVVDKTKLNDEQLIDLYSKYMDTYANLGEFDKADDYLNKIYKISKQHDQYSNEAYSYYLNKLRLATQKNNKEYKKFENNYNTLQEIYTKIKDEENDTHPVGYFSLVNYYRDVRKYEDALNVIKSYERIQNNYPDPVINYMYLVTYRDMRDIDKTIEYMNKMNKEWEKLPADSLKRLFYIGNQIEYYKIIGDADKRYKSINEAIKIVTPQKDYAPASYAQCLDYLADYYKDINQIEKSLEYKKLVLENYLKIYPQDSIRISDVYRDFGELKIKEGKYEEALQDLHKSYEISLQQRGASSLDTAEILYYIGEAYIKSGKNVKGALTIDKSAKIYANLAGKDNVKTYEKYFDKAKLLGSNKGESIIDEIIIADKEGNIKGIDFGFYRSFYSYVSEKYLNDGNKQKAMEYAQKAKPYALKPNEKQYNSYLIERINSLSE